MGPIPLLRLEAKIEEGHISIVAPFSRGIAIGRSIPGATWKNEKKRWVIPLTPVSARNLLAEIVDGDSVQHEIVKLAENSRLKKREDYEDHGSLLRPWRHQILGCNWLIDGDGALLEYGLGTGKTRCALDALLSVGARAALVVAPLSVGPAWAVQAERHHPGRFDVHVLGHASQSILKRTIAAELALKSAKKIRNKPIILVTNYESVWRQPMANFALATKWDAVIFDEIHRIKSPGSKVGLFAARLRKSSKRVWGLSGTPLAHSPLDAYGIFRAIDPGLYGTSFAAFRNKYAVMGGYGGYEVTAYKNMDDFRKRYFSLTLAAGREVLDLPGSHHVDIPIILPPQARKIYSDLSSLYVAELQSGEWVSESHALTRLLRLQQITSGYFPSTDECGDTTVEILHREKELALKDLLDSLDPSQPVVVFARFVMDLAAIQRAAASSGRKCYELSGRKRQLEDWQKASGSGDVLAVQIRSGSEGIDLTRASHCVFYSLGFSLSEFSQALARLDRPGQKFPVTYYHLVATNTVDKKVYRVLRERKRIIEEILRSKSIDEE